MSVNNELISVIVPVFNVEKYLKRCVDSILIQTYRNIEILLIDDGSTDYSSNLADEYLKKDERIRVFHKKNMGLSSARNKGIEEAKGNYVCFVDGDDTISSNMVNTLYDLLKKTKADIAACSMKVVYDEKNVIEELNKNEYEIYDSTQALLKMIDYNCGLAPNACNKLYRKDLFTKDCLYPIGKRYEDMGVTARLFVKANRIVYTPDSYYYYFQRIGSITNEKFCPKDLDHIFMSEKLYEYISNNVPKLKNEYYIYHLMNMISCCNKIICSNVKEYKSVILLTKKEIRKNFMFIMKSRVYGIKKKVQLIVFGYFYIIYKELYRRKNEKDKKKGFNN